MAEVGKADVVTVLSSDLVASVMEQYFNEVMYNTAAMGQVGVVDLAASADGFMFSLVFTKVSKAALAAVPHKEVQSRPVQVGKVHDKKSHSKKVNSANSMPDVLDIGMLDAH